MEWFSALGIARTNQRKTNASAFPYPNNKQHQERTPKLK
jgi:hypothetical protein